MSSKSKNDVIAGAILGKDGLLFSIKDDYDVKALNMTGASWETAVEALRCVKDPAEANALLLLSPLVIKSMTDKDGGPSGKIYDKIGTFTCFKDYKISGKLNRTVLRLVCAAIVQYSPSNVFDSGSRQEYFMNLAKGVITVFNPNASVGSESSKKITMETLSKMGPYLNSNEVSNSVVDLVKISGYGPKFRTEKTTANK